MKSASFSLHLFLLGICLLLGSTTPDPSPLQDYCIGDNKGPSPLNGQPCIDPKLATSAHFTTSALSKPGNTEANLFGFNVTLAKVANLPGLNTMGLTMGRIDLAAGGLVPPHSHPRASEVTVCLKGSLLVGFVDTSNQMFTQQLRAGDAFVFPKGLIHFLYNLDDKKRALAVSGLSSQNPGAQIASLASFTSKPHLPDYVLSKAFQINNKDIARIRENLGG